MRLANAVLQCCSGAHRVLAGRLGRASRYATDLGVPEHDSAAPAKTLVDATRTTGSGFIATVRNGGRCFA